MGPTSPSIAKNAPTSGIKNTPANSATIVQSIIRMTMVAMFAGVFFIPEVGAFFAVEGLVGPNVFFYLPLIYISYHIHSMLGRLCRKLLDWGNRVKQNRQQLSEWE